MNTTGNLNSIGKMSEYFSVFSMVSVSKAIAYEWLLFFLFFILNPMVFCYLGMFRVILCYLTG